MVATRTPATPAPPVVRIRRAPAYEPPTDDARRPDEHPVCPGQLALFTSVGRRPGPRYPAPRGTPAARRRLAADGWPAEAPYPPDAAPPYRPTDGLSRVPARAGAQPPAPPPTAASPAGVPVVGSPARYAGPPVPGSAHAAAHRFVAGCVEVLNNVRPVRHLRTMTSPFEYGSMVSQLTRRAVRVRMPTRPAGQPVALHCLRVFEQRSGRADAVAVLRSGDACWAMALHFERRHAGWLCTLLEVI